METAEKKWEKTDSKKRAADFCSSFACPRLSVHFLHDFSDIFLLLPGYSRESGHQEIKHLILTAACGIEHVSNSPDHDHVHEAGPGPVDLAELRLGCLVGRQGLVGRVARRRGGGGAGVVAGGGVVARPATTARGGDQGEAEREGGDGS